MNKILFFVLTYILSFYSSASESPSHAVILQYHHVSNETPQATSISPQQFSKHLQWLKDNNFQVWPLQKIVKALQEQPSKNKTGNNLPDRVVAITFDDGYKNNYEHAYPLLRKFDYPFTIFLNTKPVNDGYKSHLSWHQIKEMSENGATIANHTKTHPYLLRRENSESSEQWLKRMKEEINHAEKSIQKHTGKSEKLFAYPYGESSPKLRELLNELGYTSFSQFSGPISADSDFSQLPRFALSGNYTGIDSFAQKMWTLPFPVSDIKELASMDEGVLPYDERKPALVLTLNKDSINAATINCFASGQGAMDIEISNNRQLTIRPRKDILVGRSRYNCTARATNAGTSEAIRFHWLSHQWIRLGEHNQWQHY